MAGSIVRDAIVCSRKAASMPGKGASVCTSSRLRWAQRPPSGNVASPLIEANGDSTPWHPIDAIQPQSTFDHPNVANEASLDFVPVVLLPVGTQSAMNGHMFNWAIMFFLIALVAAIFGFTGIAASAAGIAKIVLVVALVLAVVSFVVPQMRK